MKNKKPFFETKVGRLLKIAGRVLIQKVPIVGDIAENLTSIDGGTGKLHYGKLFSYLVRLVILIVVVYAFFTGTISLDRLLELLGVTDPVTSETLLRSVSLKVWV